MAIALDAVSTGTFGGTCSHVVSSGSDRILVVGAWVDNGTAISAVASDLDGALLEAGTIQVWVYAVNIGVSIFYKIAPSVGTHVLTETQNGTGNMMLGSSWFGVHQSVPLGTAVGNDDDGTGTTPATVDVGSAAGDLVIDFVYCKSGGLTVGAGQTQRINVNPSGANRFGVSTEPGGGTITMSWDLTATLETWGIKGVALKPAEAAGGGATGGAFTKTILRSRLRTW